MADPVPICSALAEGTAPAVTQKVFFDLSIGGQPAGRVVLGLYGELYLQINGLAYVSAPRHTRPSHTRHAHSPTLAHTDCSRFASWCHLDMRHR